MISVILSALRNLPFIVWLLAQLRRLRVFRRNIAVYRASGNDESERGEILKATSVWGDDIVRKLRVDLRAEGETALPDGPAVFVSNHESYADIPLFCSVVKNKQFGFVAKQNLSRIPVFGKWIADIRSVFIERDDLRASLKSIDDGVALLHRGFSLVVFPEGTRGRGAPMGAFKKGSLRLATKPGLPVVPVTHSGCFRIFEESGVIKKNKRVRFFVHPPIETAHMSKHEAAALTETVENIIRSKLSEWAAEEKERENGV
ncbi:MAG: 1-acyl-sn-glycerol-3-phosphate acyltransferase [Clostridiales Family XIII bacterium]|jgi:1-acyl-sn-glycerol-3-phosphate acyltransferase|nr:1-acyl-sn-glycerol-3-phosphate acyltransferase [Clostridiales Family XIII bacterium]